MKCPTCGAGLVMAGGVLCNAVVVRLRVAADGEDSVIDAAGRTYRGHVEGPAAEPQRRRWWTVTGRTPHVDTCTAGPRARRMGHGPPLPAETPP